MLSQRLAKAALIGRAAERQGGSGRRGCHGSDEGPNWSTASPFSAACRSATLRSAGELAQATQAWERFQGALMQLDTRTGQASMAVLSEALLAHLDRLTDHIERGVQALVR